MKMKKLPGRAILTAFLTVFILIATQVPAQQVKLYASKDGTSVTYSMKHPLHEWEGTSKDVSSVIMYDKTSGQISSVAVLIKVASFDSQNANRDSHMIEAVEGIKYPQVTFTSKSVITDANGLMVAGTLSFHGISNDISFPVELKKSKKDLIATGKFEVKMPDYKIDSPTLMAIPCDDVIKLRFTAKFILPE